MDSPLIPVGPFRQRRSFLGDDYEGDDRLAAWAEETGRLKPIEREGSTFYEVDDPTAPGGKRYVARKNSVGAPSGARTMTKDDGSAFVTQDKSYKPRLTVGKAMSFRGDFDKDMANKQAETERQRALAERIAEEQRAEDAAVRREDRSWGREKEKLSFLKSEREADPEMMALREDRKRMRLEADTERTSTTGLKSILDNPEADYPGYSRGAEETMRQELAGGASAQQAKAAGRLTHQQELAEAKRLYASGDPDSVAMADKLVANDKDLAQARSFLPADYQQKNALRQEQSLMDIGGPLSEQLQPKRKLPSFIDAGINLALPGWSAGGGLLNLMADPEADNQAIRPAIDRAVLEMQSKNRIDKPAAINALRKYLLRNRVPPQRVDALLPVTMG